MLMMKSNLIKSLYLVLITAGNKSNASVKPNSYSITPCMLFCVGKFWFKLKSETTLQFSRNKKNNQYLPRQTVNHCTNINTLHHWFSTVFHTFLPLTILKL